MQDFSTLKVAIVHDWLVTYRGGEKVLEELCQIFPNAPIYTLFCDPKSLSPGLRTKDIRCAKWPNYLRYFRKLMLPILPAMIESIDLWEYDLVLSTSSCVAKGVIPAPHAVHVSYVHSPMRYIWDQSEHYFGRLFSVYPIKLLINLLLKNLRVWDVTSSVRVDRFVANSRFIAQRIKRYYGREAVVIYPPVVLKLTDQVGAGPTKLPEQPYFVAAGALESYKRFDLAILACEHQKKRLIVCGRGSDEKRLRKLAGPYTQFVIAPDDATLSALLGGAEAMLFPGVEDFGMIAVEALALATPLIAFARGGALEYVKDGHTGVLFHEQTVACLAKAVENFSSSKFLAEDLKAEARRFSREAFIEGIKAELTAALQGKD